MYPLAVVFAQSIEAMCYVENEDVVGAAPTGDAPTTSELSTILLPTKVRLILEVLRYVRGWGTYHHDEYIVQRDNMDLKICRFAEYEA